MVESGVLRHPESNTRKTTFRVEKELPLSPVETRRLLDAFIYTLPHKQSKRVHLSGRWRCLDWLVSPATNLEKLRGILEAQGLDMYRDLFTDQEKAR